MKINKSDLFKLAHVIAAKEKISFSEAMKKAWMVSRLQARLMSEKVSFTFRMLNGNICNAYGTLANINYTPKTNSKRVRPVDQIGYWDVFCNGFRSFVAGNLISVNN